MYILQYLRHIHLNIYIFSFRGGESQERRASQLGAEKNLFQILAEKAKERQEGAKKDIQSVNKQERKKLAKTVRPNAKSRENLEKTRARRKQENKEDNSPLSFAEQMQQRREEYLARVEARRNATKQKMEMLRGGRKQLKTRITRSRGGESEREGQERTPKFFVANLFGRTRQRRNGETTASNEHLGSLSKKFESGNRGPYAWVENDNGHGPSAGTYMMNRDKGVLRKFQKKYNIRPGKKGWFAAVDKYGPKKFQALEHAFIQEENYGKLFGEVRVRNKERFSLAMKNVLWSTAVQHGPGRKSVINLINSSGVIPGNRASERKLIQQIYNLRGELWTPGKTTRYASEKKLALEMLDGGNNSSHQKRKKQNNNLVS